MFNVFLALFALSALMSVWPAYDPVLAYPTVSITLASIAAGYGLLRWANTERRVRLAATVFWAAGVGLAAYFIAQYRYQIPTDKINAISRLGRWTTFLPDLHGPVFHPNTVASLLITPLCLGIAATLATSSPRARRAGLALGTMVILYAFGLTVSRGAWLAMGFTTLAWLALRLPRFGRLAASLSLALGLGTLLAPSVVPSIHLPVIGTLTLGREHLLLDTLTLAGDYAITGLGIGDLFPAVYARFSAREQVLLIQFHAHNLWVAAWLNQGLLGVTALLGLCGTALTRVFQTRSPSVTLTALTAALSATLLHGLVDSPEYAGRYATMPVLLLLISLVIAASTPAPRTEPGWPRRFQITTGILTVGIIAAALIWHTTLEAIWHTNQGAIAETRAHLTPDLSSEARNTEYRLAQTEYELALKLEPHWTAANRRLGNLLLNLQQFEAAVPYLEAAYTQESAYPATHKGLTLAYAWTHRTAEAAAIARQARDPDQLETELYTWGDAWRDAGLPEIAAYSWEAALAMYPDRPNPVMWVAVGDMYHAAGQDPLARFWYESALRLEPNNDRAKQALEALGP